MSGIFLSHNYSDKDFARRIANDLKLKGLKVWIDEAEIKIGESLLYKIQHGITEMEYLGVILSNSSVNSSWVTLELQMAMSLEISNKNIKVLPILYKPCDIPLFLRDKKYVDFTDDKKYDDSIEHLLDTLLSRPPSLFLTAKDAARLVKVTQHPDGILCGLSQQGISQQYIWYMSLSDGRVPDWKFADVKTGRSRVWIIDYYNEAINTIYPYGILDGEVTDFPSATLMNTVKVIYFNFIDSDIAIPTAIAKAKQNSGIPDDDSQFFVNAKMTYFNDYNDYLWVVMFFDVTLSISTYAVGINARSGSVIFSKVPGP